MRNMRFIGITKDALTAGPGKRLEFFTKGCIRGVISPCEGCFNKSTWTFSGNYKEYKTSEVVDLIERDAWNKKVTFCGGEPILQGKSIIEVAKLLKEKDPGYHFVMYTMYKVDTLMKFGLNFIWMRERDEPEMLEQLKDYSSNFSTLKKDEDGNPLVVKFEILTKDDVANLLKYIDLIVDGEYKHELRMTTHETMHAGGFIGSSNQRVIDGPKTYSEGNLVYLNADKYVENYFKDNRCKTCTVIIKDKEEYCSFLCEEANLKRKGKKVFKRSV